MEDISRMDCGKINSAGTDMQKFFVLEPQGKAYVMTCAVKTAIEYAQFMGAKLFKLPS